MIKTKELFNECHNDIINELLKKYNNPVDIIANLEKEILMIGPKLDKNTFSEIKKNVWVAKTCQIMDNVMIEGPCIIMDNVVLRHNSYIRKNVIIGEESVVGNASEIKNSLLINHDAIPHFNYVGDSVLGNYVHLGAGVILANLRFDQENIKVDNEITSLRKIGAFVGDNTEIGCNSVVFPGTIIMPGSMIYPLSRVNKMYPEKNIKPRSL